jgi:ABC-type transporter Mla subunit MlaD
MLLDNLSTDIWIRYVLFGCPLKKQEDFLMSLNTANMHTQTKVGTCPHGLPPGACPICSGMAGGNSTTKRDTPRNVGEMTYNQCAAIGAMLRAQKHAKQQAQAAEQSRMEALANFRKNISATHQRLTQFAAMISETMPAIIAKPVNFILNTIVGNVLKFVHNLPTTISNFINTISTKFADITDKLAAVFGEAKNAVEEKLSKFFSDIKKKLKLFFITGTSETDDEENKIEEDKRQFEIKTFIHKLYQKLKNQDEKEVEKDEH